MTLRFFARPGDRTDRQRIVTLLANALDPDQLRAAHALAARRLLDRDGETAPADGCAVVLSVLMQGAGFDVPDLFWAVDVAPMLLARGWTEVPPGSQQAGDIGSTCRDDGRHPGEDHLYLVARLVNQDEMIVIDHQAAYPHFRWASGQGRAPTTVFYRPPPTGEAP